MSTIVGSPLEGYKPEDATDDVEAIAEADSDGDGSLTNIEKAIVDRRPVPPPGVDRVCIFH